MSSNPVFSVAGLSSSEFRRKVNEMANLFDEYDISGLSVWMKLFFSDPRTFNPRQASYKIRYMRYSLENVAELADVIENPSKAWTLPEEIGSDVKYYLDKGPNQMELVRMQFVGKVGPENNTKKGAWNKGSFFPFLLDERYKYMNCPEAEFIRKELEHPTIEWKNKYQILLFEPEESLKKILAEKDEETKEDFPITDPVISTPCLLWALKGQLSDEDYEEFAKKKILYGICNRTEILTDFLKEKGYPYDLSKNFSNRNHFGSAKDPKCVKVSYFAGHWMRNGVVCYHGKQVRISTFLERCLHYGLLKKMTAYQLACCFKNQSFAAMEYIEKGIEAAFQMIPEKTVVECPEGWYQSVGEKKFNPYKDYPTRAVFFDFEADTSGPYHKPFLVSACCYDLTEDGSQGRCVMPMTSWWGEDCAKNFAEKVYNLGKELPYKKNKKRAIRLYAYNSGKYDLNFIIPYLKQIKLCARKTKIYSADGLYHKEVCYQKRKGALTIEVWDAYLLFCMSLARAARAADKGGFLKPEQANTIKKEMFPYNAYTYNFFEEHKMSWVSPELMKEGFIEEDNEGNSYLNEKKYNEFLLTLKHTLPFIPEYKEEQIFSTKSSRLIYKSNLYKQEEYCGSEEGYIELFNYKEYAIFYCEQDVRCLTQIMFNMEEICMGRELDGVQGTVPFKIHVWNHRTASSIGYDNLLMNTVYKQDENNPAAWVPRHDFYFLGNEGREIVQRSVRGGRCMLGDNKQQRWEQDPEKKEYMYDVDANSLYPSTMCKLLWITDGKPSLYKGDFSEQDFKELFTHPWCPPDGEEKQFNDGVIHIIGLHCNKKLCLPRLCIKDPKTKLNEWKNWDGIVNTWVNAKDAWDLIEHQEATFEWDKALVLTGKRWFEIRDCVQQLYDFRVPNKKLGVGNVAKLMMNSSYGKSTLKMIDEAVVVVDGRNWDEYFESNAYRIKSFEELTGKADPNIDNWMTKYLVKLYYKDTSFTFNMFGSDVLAGSKCIMQRPTSIMEEVAAEKGLNPRIYYTDTDSTHVLSSVYNEAKERYYQKYHQELEGNATGQFHPDFDPLPGNEPVRGSVMFIGNGKKIYVDKLEGINGGEGYHSRMKGVPNSCINAPQDYEDLWEGKTITKNLLGYGKVSFEVKGGNIKSRQVMKRTLEAHLERNEEEVKKAKQDTETDIETEEENNDDFTEILSSQEPWDEEEEVLEDIDIE